MKLTTLCSIVFLAAASPAVAAVPTPAEEKEVMAAMTAWIEATAKRDVAALQRLLHDELVYSHSDARSQTKAELLKEAQEGRGPGGVALRETTLHIYGGSTAVLRGRVGGGGRGGANAAASPISVVVFVKGPAGWQVVSRSATRPPAAAQK